MPDWNAVLLRYGISVPFIDEFVIHCPFHDDHSASCSINVAKGVWVCFAGCGQGSLKSFVWKLSGRPWAEISEELETQTWELDVSFSNTTRPEEMPPTPVEQPGPLTEIPDNHWIYKRGFTKETLMKWGCKCNKYFDLLIPIETRESEILGWIARRQQATPKYLFSRGLAKSKSLFGINHLSSVETLFVVEGALDAMWLDQHNYPSVAVLGASVSKAQIDLISTLHPTEVVLSLDSDEAGQRGIAKATIDMNNRFLLSYLELPIGCKDVQEIRNAQQLAEVLNQKALW